MRILSIGALMGVASAALTDILTDFSLVQNGTIQVRTLVDGFRGECDPPTLRDIPYLLNLQKATTNLANLIADTSDDLYDFRNLTNREAIEVASALAALPTTVNATLDSVIAKKPVFDHAIFGLGSVSFLLKSSLEKLQANVAELGRAVSKRMPAAYATILSIQFTAINQQFDNALAVYRDTPLFVPHYTRPNKCPPLKSPVPTKHIVLPVKYAINGNKTTSVEPGLTTAT